jgi:hypothetical protein
LDDLADRDVARRALKGQIDFVLRRSVACARADGSEDASDWREQTGAGAMVEAITAGTPMLHLTGQIESEFLDRDLGFIHDLRRIVGLLPRKRQTLFFSATMPKAIEDLAAPG